MKILTNNTKKVKTDEELDRDFERMREQEELQDWNDADSQWENYLSSFAN